MLNFATYNIHRCIGTDGRHDVERTLAVLNELNADVIALQEVESSRQDSADVLRYFASQLDMAVIPGPTMEKTDTRYGNALLTRLPCTGIQKLDLSLPGREPRGAISAQVQQLEQPLKVVATHLGLRPYERRLQVKKLISHFEFNPDHSLLLMGDVNEWFLWGRPLRWLHRVFSATPSRRSFPSRAPLLALDRVWIHPADRLVDLYAHRSVLARQASDHLPLVAQARIKRLYEYYSVTGPYN